MVNLVKMQDALKNLSDDAIKAQLTNPTGEIPSFLLASELARRDATRAESQNPPSKTVTDDLVEPPAPPPSSPMMAGAPAASTPNMAAPPATGTAQQLMAGAPTPASQGIATLRKGGVVRMAEGGGFLDWWNGLVQTNRDKIDQEQAALEIKRGGYNPNADTWVHPAGRAYEPQLDWAGNPVDPVDPVTSATLPLPPRDPRGAPARAGAAVGVPPTPDAVPSALTELRDASRGLNTAHAAALEGFKVDPEKRSKDRVTDALMKFSLNLLADKSGGKGLSGALYAAGVAGGPALEGMQADKTAERNQQQKYAEAWLAGRKEHLDALVAAGNLTQRAAAAQLQYDASMASTGAHSASTAEARAARSQSATEATEARRLNNYHSQRHSVDTRHAAMLAASISQSDKDAVMVKWGAAQKMLDDDYARWTGRSAGPVPPEDARVYPNSQRP